MVGLGASWYYNSRETFTQNDDGEYSAEIPINIVAALPFDLLLGYSGDSFALYVKYRYMGVVPYNEVYPVMPVSLFGIGVRFNLNCSYQ